MLSGPVSLPFQYVERNVRLGCHFGQHYLFLSVVYFVFRGYSEILCFVNPRTSNRRLLPIENIYNLFILGFWLVSREGRSKVDPLTVRRKRQTTLDLPLRVDCRREKVPVLIHKIKFFTSHICHRVDPEFSISLCRDRKGFHEGLNAYRCIQTIYIRFINKM